MPQRLVNAINSAALNGLVFGKFFAVTSRTVFAGAGMLVAGGRPIAFMRAGCNPPNPSFINYATQVVCDLLVRLDALSVMPFGAVKSALASGIVKVVHTPAEFQIPAYAMYKPVQAVSDSALACFERAILQVASSLEETHRATHARRASPPAGRRKRNRRRATQ